MAWSEARPSSKRARPSCSSRRGFRSSEAALATSAKRRTPARSRPDAASRSSAAFAAAGRTSRSRKSAVAPSPSPSSARASGSRAAGQAVEPVGGPAGRVADGPDGVEVHPALPRGGRHGPGGRLEPLGRRAEAGAAEVGDLAAEEPDLVAGGAGDPLAPGEARGGRPRRSAG